MSEINQKFEKLPLSIPEQVKLLKGRGLIIENESRAVHTLQYIGYYHFSAYMLNFQRADRSAQHHQFIEGATFEKILNLYDFDRKLRLLVMDAIERIEIAVKSCVTNEMSVDHGAHWYMDQQLFNPRMRHGEFLTGLQKELDANKEKGGDLFIRHYFDTYAYPTLPPGWMIFETVTFGRISLLFSNILRADQKRISAHFSQSPEILQSWLRSISYVRNLCAHHSRLWNRIFAIKPKVPTTLAEEMKIVSRFYAQAIVLQSIMLKISPESRWAEKLKELFAANSQIDIFKMGFPKDWQSRSIWK